MKEKREFCGSQKSIVVVNRSCNRLNVSKGKCLSIDVDPALQGPLAPIILGQPCIRYICPTRPPQTLAVQLNLSTSVSVPPEIFDGMISTLARRLSETES